MLCIGKHKGARHIGAAVFKRAIPAGEKDSCRRLTRQAKHNAKFWKAGQLSDKLLEFCDVEFHMKTPFWFKVHFLGLTEMYPLLDRRGKAGHNTTKSCLTQPGPSRLTTLGCYSLQKNSTTPKW